MPDNESKQDGKPGSDDVSIASSLSSIPLKDLKKHLKKKQKESAVTGTAKLKKESASSSSSTNKKTVKKSDTIDAIKLWKKPAVIKKPPKEETTKSKTKPRKAAKKSTEPANKLLSPVPEKKTTVRNGSKSSKQSHASSSGNTSSSEEEEAACCLCHCGVDCSDRALFFPKDRKKELQDEDGDYYFQMEDPFLPEVLYDRHNALVYCDCCNRLYHQKCHFVPLLVVPRGDWNCLLCSLKHQKTQLKKDAKAKSISAFFQEPWTKFCEKTICKELFPSPPPATLSTHVHDLQDEFELSTALPKAQMWHRQLRQLQNFLKSQAGNIRMATMALDTLTSTKRNRAHYASGGKKSQELAQTLSRLATAKWKIRVALLSLENIRVTGNALPSELLQWGKDHPKHLAHVFPHGTELYEMRRRIIPRTREMVVVAETTAVARTNVESLSNGTWTKPAIPMVIIVPSPKTLKRIKSISVSSPKSPKILKSIVALSSPKSPKRIKSPNSPKRIKAIAALSPDSKKKTIHLPGVNGSKAPEKEDDDDSGISLDDLKCCVCFVGDATDDNDVLLCDGQGCCRAFHMACIFPQVQAKDLEDEEEDWFCPLCSAISHLTAEVQLACMDQDWEHRRETEDYHKNETSSLHSWGNAAEVFPEAEWEYETSLKYKAGKQNEDTARLLGIYLGEDFFQAITGGTIPMPVGSDSEDENDYSLFDEESFEERKRRERQGGGDDDDDDDENDDDHDDSDKSTRSSEASLVDMSSVELNIGKSELAALSDGGDDSSNEDSASSGASSASSSPRQRLSRRLRNKSNQASGHSSLADPGADFDENNIIQGKRRRTAVDYRKLNDALFGDLSEKEKAKIDDQDDFQVQKRKKTGKIHNGGAKKRKKANSDKKVGSESSGTEGQSDNDNSSKSDSCAS
jgi:hypothetical protein